MFSYEKLEAFQVARALRKAVVGRVFPRCRGDLRAQLDRATSSIMFNIAEGAGRRSPGEKRKFYEYGLGSVNETGAILSLLHTDGLLPDADFTTTRDLADRVSRMIFRLAESTNREPTPRRSTDT